MKICWDNLEGLRYSKKTGKWRGNTTYIYKESCKNCGEPYLSAEKSTGDFCSLKCSSTGINNGMYGKEVIVTNETKQKMSISHMGHFVTNETRLKISKSNKNKIFTQEHKDRISKSHKGKKLSKEHKDKISNTLKKYFRKYPEKHPNRRLAGNRKKWTYPEKLAAKWLDNENISYIYNKRILNFYPDFSINNLLIEIDGKRWHDPIKDNIRDSKLQAEGYQIIRIDAKVVIEGLEKYKPIILEA